MTISDFRINKIRLFLYSLVIVIGLEIFAVSSFIAYANTDVAIDTVNFPDAVFRKYVSETFDADKNGLLSALEIQNAKLIDVMYSMDDLYSIKGVEFFTELEDLDCSGNSISSLDLSKNTKLIRLDCSNNKLKELDVSSLKELEWLKCNQNQISDLNISNNTKLSILKCSNNQLKQLVLSNNHDIWDLECEGNSISSIDVTPISHLVTFRADSSVTANISAGVFVEDARGDEYMITDAASVEYWCPYNPDDDEDDENYVPSLKSAAVPDSVIIFGKTYKVTQIHEGAFNGYGKLKKVTIGKNVKSIGKNAFKGCKKLKTITIKSKVLKKIGSKAFKSIYKKAVIKVPKSKKTKYKKLIKKAGAGKKVRIK